MSKLLIKDKQVVVPGEKLADGMDYLPGRGTYRDNDAIVSQLLGLVNVDGRALKIIPLAGRYNPRRKDIIICRVTDVSMNGWIVDTNSAYHAMISMKDGTSSYIERGADLTKYYDIGDYVVAEVINVTSQKLVDLTMKGPGLRKLRGGRVIPVSPHKVPRIIGKQGSMITMIKQATNCNMTVGQNGLVWIQGKPKDMVAAAAAVHKINTESHLPGLTDEVSKLLKENETKQTKE